MSERFRATRQGYRLDMNRCPGCGSLRLMITIDGAHGFCTRCRRRLVGDEVRPLFARVVGLGDRLTRDPDPQPAA